MVKVKDTKLTADIDDQATEYVTFWGKIKGNIQKQEDLIDLINNVKGALTSSIESLKSNFKKEIKDLKTSDLENDGNGDKVEGEINPFVTKDVTDSLDNKIDSVKDDIIDDIYEPLLEEVTSDVLSNILDEDLTNTINEKVNDAVDVATKDVVDDITAEVKEDVESLIPVDVSELVNDAGYAKESDLSLVATTGSYNDLTNKPVIPAAQVNSDWNSDSGVSQILNKPVIPTATSQLTNDSGFITNVKTINNESIIGEGNITIEGGGSGTGDYDDLENKPSINNVELSGNKTASDLGLQETIQDLAEIRSNASAGLKADDIGAGDGINISDSSEGKIVVSNTVDVGYSVERNIVNVTEDVPFEATVDYPTTGYVSFEYSSVSSESAIFLDGITSNNIPNEITVTTYEGKSYELPLKDADYDKGVYFAEYKSNEHEHDSKSEDPYISLTIVATENNAYVLELDVISDTATETESGTYEKSIEMEYSLGTDIEVTDDFKDAVDYVTGYSLNQPTENMLLRQCHVHEEGTIVNNE